MAWRRNKINTNWHKLLKQDATSVENGFTKRLFRQSEVYDFTLSWYDYPKRSISRSWKDQSKKRKQWEQ